MRNFGACFLKFIIEEFVFCLVGSTTHWVFEYVVLLELQSSLGFDTKKLRRRFGILCISCAE